MTATTIRVRVNPADDEYVIFTDGGTGRGQVGEGGVIVEVAQVRAEENWIRSPRGAASWWVAPAVWYTPSAPAPPHRIPPTSPRVTG